MFKKNIKLAYLRRKKYYNINWDIISLLITMLLTCQIVCTYIYNFAIDIQFGNFLFTRNFNTNISHQIFDYSITFVNSQHKNTNSKGDFVLKSNY